MIAPRNKLLLPSRRSLIVGAGAAFIVPKLAEACQSIGAPLTDPWATLDGRLNASTGTGANNLPFTTILNGYPLNSPLGARVRYPTNTGSSGQPPWMVAGVDYAVGPNAAYGTSIPWKVPGVDALPAGCTLGTKRITVNNANTIIDGWDCTQNGGQSFLVWGAGSQFTNNKLLKTEGSYANFDVYGANVLIAYNDINANGYDSDGAMIRTSSGATPITIMYNYLRYPGSDILYPSNTPSGNWTLKYNVLADAGCIGGHPDWLQVGGGTYTLVLDFNLVVQRMTPGGSQPFSCYYLSGACSHSYNTILTLHIPSPAFPGSNNVNGIFSCHSIGTATMPYDYNYIDPTGLLGNGYGRGAIWDSFAGTSQANDWTMDLNRLTTVSNP